MRGFAVTTLPGPFGPMTAAASRRGVCLLSFGRGVVAEPKGSDGAEGGAEPGEHLDVLRRELAAYFKGTPVAFSVPLDLGGTVWQRRVWRALTRIPCGETVSYAQLARRLGNPRGARAAGLANGANRVAVVVPCHRVIASDGTLGGYAGGLDRKRWLLDHEAGMSGERSLFRGSA